LPAEAGEAARAVEHAARAAYGRLVAWLGGRSRDIAGAEDALADAFAAALATWPREGVPRRPEAWLLAVARRRMIDAARRRRTRDDAVATLLLAAEAEPEAAAFPDERLMLLFVCAHPAIDPAARTPLMLQTVLGLTAAEIAAAFLVTPAAMGQRLVRAKEKIRTAGIGFRIPDAPELAERTEAVLQAIYAAYGTGWEAAGPSALATEAIWLARTLAGLLDDEPEALGLLALLLFCESRRDARRDGAGRFVPLGAQDVALWSDTTLAEARGLLGRAAGFGRIGRFQIEAAIQSVHAARRESGETDWPAIALLYEGLHGLAPTLGVAVGRAAALAEVQGPAAGLAALAGLAGDTYQPYWVLRADLLRRLGRADEARVAGERARALTADPALRAFLAGGVAATEA
jgi:RNA polymerase sigma-70 factor (ECF subfamily)